MVSRLGSLVQWCCGEGGALQTDLTGLCGEHAQCSGHSGFDPTHRTCATLLRLQAALYGAGPALNAVPVFGFSTKAQTRLGLRSVPSPAGAAQTARSWTRALSPGAGAPSPLRSPSLSFCACGRRSGAPCVCSEELVSSRDPPGGCQPSRISGSLWLEPVCSLVGDAVSGAEFSPFPSPLPPASGREWACPQPASSSLELPSPSFVL